jgi:drug/metabolite transporter (DMT)-like permease
MLCGAVAFSVMATLASSLGATFPWQWIAVGRSTVPFLVFWALAWFGRVPLPLWKPGTLWIRSLAGSLSLVLTFFALTRLPSSDVLTLTNIFPVWVVVLSWPLLGHRPTWGMAFSALIAVAGCALILQPHFAEGNLATFAALAASLTTSVAMMGLHRLHRFPTLAIVWHFSGVSLLFCFAAIQLFEVAPRGSEPATLASWVTLVGVGVAAMLGQFCLTKAFTLGVPARVSVIGLTQVGFVVVFEMLFRGRIVGPTTLAGMALVLAPTAWLLTRPTPSHDPIESHTTVDAGHSQVDSATEADDLVPDSFVGTEL